MEDKLTPQSPIGLIREFHEALYRDLDLEKIALQSKEEINKSLIDKIHELVAKKKNLTDDLKNTITEGVLNEIFGLGPIEPLFEDPTITDIFINAFDSVYVESFGKTKKTDVRFYDKKHLENFVSRLTSRCGRRIDKSTPYVNIRLEDGSRINIIIPPASVDAPKISIRKFPQKTFTFVDLIKFKEISEEGAELLKIAAKSRLNIIVAGPTGAGKTTLLNAISEHIPSDERIVTIEDVAELRLQQQHVVRLETRLANVEGKAEITADMLLENALRMRPDRIILGDVRGREAFNVLHAMNTGHDGSMATLHANGAKEAIFRLVNMILMTGYLFTPKVLEQQIANAVDLIVYATMLPDGTRRVLEISDVTVDGDGNTLTSPLITAVLGGPTDGDVSKQFVLHKNEKPSFYDKLVIHGQEKRYLQLVSGIFAQSKNAQS